MKRHINQIADLLLCRMCDKRGERVSPSEMIMQCDNVVKVKRPDILVLIKTNECIIVDIPILGQSKIQEQEFETTDKCQDLKRVNRKMSGVQNVHLVPFVLRAVTSLTKKRGQ